MTLQEIREVKTLEELKPAIIYLCDHMHDMTFGEFAAFKNTIQAKGKELNIDWVALNQLAAEYQGY